MQEGVSGQQMTPLCVMLPWRGTRGGDIRARQDIKDKINISSCKLRAQTAEYEEEEIQGRTKRYKIGCDAGGGVGTTNDTAVCNAPTEEKKDAINLPCDSGQKQGGPEAEDAI